MISCAVTETEVNKFLDSQHIQHSSNGYRYLLKALTLLCNNEKLRNGRRVMKVYDAVAEECHSTRTRVERGIRTVLQKANWKQTNGTFLFWACDTLYYGDSDRVSIGTTC